jgi:hypothetical protein
VLAKGRPADDRGRRRAFPIPPRGLETPAQSPKNSTNLAPGGVKSGALAPKTQAIDPALAALIDAWPTLPDAIRAGIVAMVRAAGG